MSTETAAMADAAMMAEAAVGETIEFNASRHRALLDAVARTADRIRDSGSLLEAMREIPGILGRATGVSRVYIFEHVAHSREDSRMSQRFEWCAPGVQPQIDSPELQDADLAEMGFGRWVKELRAGRAIVGDVEQFPDAELPILQMQEIDSVLVQPIFSADYWWGFIGFDSCGGKRTWDPMEVDVLRIAAHVCGTALALEARDAESRAANKMDALGRMAGGVAHDFNNLLTVIGGNIELLQAELTDEPFDEIRSIVAVMEQATTQAIRLTRQLLTFSNPRHIPAPVTKPEDVLQNLSPVLRQIAGPHVEFKLETALGVEPVWMVAEQLEQVILNLVSNSRDAMPKGGSLTVSLATVDAGETHPYSERLGPGRYTLLTVRDTGHGIPLELHDRVFEPFFTTRGPTEGTGFGLATVYGAVSAASGSLRLTSAPEQGTEIRVYLPVAVTSPT